MALFRKKKKQKEDAARSSKRSKASGIRSSSSSGKRKRQEEDFDDEDEEDEIELVMFGGSVNGIEANLSENARLAEAGLIPAKNFVTDALIRRAERFRVEPRGKTSSVRMYVDGIKYDGGRLAGRQSLAIVQMLKLLAGLDIKERTINQSGGILAEFEKIKYILSVEVAPTKAGPESLNIRVVDFTNRPDKPEELGFPEAIPEAVRSHSSGGEGLLVACGAPGTGTTSTRFGILRAIDGFIYSVFSIADTENRDTTIVTDYDTSEDEDFDMSITKLKRIEADVLFLDPLTNAQAAKEVFQLQKKLCYITELTALDAADGITRLIDWVGDPKVVAEGLKIIVSQKLIRKLCDECKDAYRPSPKLITKVGLPPETGVLYRALLPPEQYDDEEEEEEEYFPCAKCEGIGYYGRTAMYEMIEMTDAMKKVILSDSVDANAIRKQARTEEMLGFSKEAVRLVAEGITSLEEVQRTFRTKKTTKKKRRTKTK